MGGSYIQRVTEFFESYFESPGFYYQDGKRVIRQEAVQDLLRQLVAMGVFRTKTTFGKRR